MDYNSNYLHLSVSTGVLLAILERAGLISPLYSQDGIMIAGTGTVSAGYQNFVLCLEMPCAALGLWLAFPYKPFQTMRQSAIQGNGDFNPSHVRGNTLQSISSNLKETINPKDVVVDVLHNFHPHYQGYTQHSSTPSNQPIPYPSHKLGPLPPEALGGLLESAPQFNYSSTMADSEIPNGFLGQDIFTTQSKYPSYSRDKENYQQQPLEVPQTSQPAQTQTTVPDSRTEAGAALNPSLHRRSPSQGKSRVTEKIKLEAIPLEEKSNATGETLDVESPHPDDKEPEVSIMPGLKPKRFNEKSNLLNHKDV